MFTPSQNSSWYHLWGPCSILWSSQTQFFHVSLFILTWTPKCSILSYSCCCPQVLILPTFSETQVNMLISLLHSPPAFLLVPVITLAHFSFPQRMSSKNPLLPLCLTLPQDSVCLKYHSASLFAINGQSSLSSPCKILSILEEQISRHWHVFLIYRHVHSLTHLCL